MMLRYNFIQIINLNVFLLYNYCSVFGKCIQIYLSYHEVWENTESEDWIIFIHFVFGFAKPYARQASVILNIMLQCYKKYIFAYRTFINHFMLCHHSLFILDLN